jgi:hypothetical protein
MRFKSEDYSFPGHECIQQKILSALKKNCSFFGLTLFLTVEAMNSFLETMTSLRGGNTGALWIRDMKCNI